MAMGFADDLGGIVNGPRFWASQWGHEYWMVGGSADIITAMAAANSGLSGFGWITTTLSVTEGTAGDFISSADQDETRIVFGASGDLLVSPRVFGSYDSGLIASRSLGYMPTALNLEVYAAWSVTTANEPASFIGFAPSTTTSATGAGGAAGIYSNGTNFVCAGVGGTNTGAARDALWHKFGIKVTSTITEWFIDDVSQGTFTTSADVWPSSLHIRASTTNRLDVAWARVWYS